MGRLFWRSNENREKARFLRRWDVIARSGSDEAISYIYARDCHALRARNDLFRAQNNSLAFGSLRYFAWKRYSQPLLFAKISNVIANQTFPEKCGRPRSLAKISNASHKSSLFPGLREGLLFAKISNVIADRAFSEGWGWFRSLIKISNASYKWRENYCRGLIYQTRENGLNKLNLYSADK
jgi:hypothetical protein